MYQRCRFVAVLLLAGFAVPAYGQDVKLEWKFQAGKPFYQEMTTSTKQSMKVMGQAVDQTQTQTFYFSWTPKEQDKDKNWIVVQKIEAVKMDIEIAGQKIPYDSTKDQASTGPLAEFFKALVGSEFKLTISPEMKVTKIEGRAEFISKLVKANPQMEPLLNQILGEDALKQMSDASFAVIPSPSKAVKKGESWTPEKKTLNMGLIGSYETTAKFTYEGQEGKLYKIKVETGLNYVPPGANAGATLPFKIKAEGTKLTSKDASGTILFDNEKHRLDHSTQTLKLEGTLKIDIGGMTSDVELTQEQTTKVTTTDTNPIAPPKKP